MLSLFKEQPSSKEASMPEVKGERRRERGDEAGRKWPDCAGDTNGGLDPGCQEAQRERLQLVGVAESGQYLDRVAGP